ncbi:MAG: LytR/AlgR family response regulator transcription factor [Gemmatimonadaceae bacterium]
MREYSVIIADDEPLARERLRGMLANRHECRVVAECRNGAEARDAIRRLRPDIVLLDIKMPGLDGIEVAEAISQHQSAVIFVTAHDEFALRAFDVNALDYVLKPVDQSRLDLAIDRAEKRQADGAGRQIEPGLLDFLETLRAERAYATKFLIRGSGDLYFVRVEDIEWADAQGNYVRLHAGGKFHMLRRSFSDFEASLDPRRFVRIHRSTIVNIEQVSRLAPQGHGEYVVTLTNGAKLNTSRTYADRLQSILK